MQGMQLPLKTSTVNYFILKNEIEPISEMISVPYKLRVETKSKYTALNFMSHHSKVTRNLTSSFAK
jgi:hypothetical protein